MLETCRRPPYATRPAPGRAGTSDDDSRNAADALLAPTTQGMCLCRPIASSRMTRTVSGKDSARHGRCSWHEHLTMPCRPRRSLVGGAYASSQGTPQHGAPRHAALLKDDDVLRAPFIRDGVTKAAMVNQKSETGSTDASFAAMKVAGFPVTWVTQAVETTVAGCRSNSSRGSGGSSGAAFAAVTVGGSLVTWGYPSSGGDGSRVSSLHVDICPLWDTTQERHPYRPCR